MEFTPAETNGIRLIEGRPDEPLLAEAADATLLVEACLSAGVEAVLLYPTNLTARFFDLSSSEAGVVLQKLRNYRIRLAVVCEPGAVRCSTRFGEMVAEERQGRYFGVFETREEAVRWLGTDGTFDPTAPA
jgi:hypothetical protein